MSRAGGGDLEWDARVGRFGALVRASAQFAHKRPVYGSTARGSDRVRQRTLRNLGHRFPDRTPVLRILQRLYGQGKVVAVLSPP